MSPIIFNMVVDRLFGKLPPEIGFRIGKLSLNAMGFADDLVLMAQTAQGLQILLDTAADYLQSCGLSVNAAKCFTVSLKNVPHEKKTVVDGKQKFVCQGRSLPALKRSDEWTYLGIKFTPEGRLKSTPLEKLKTFSC